MTTKTPNERAKLIPYHHLYYTRQQRRRPYQRELIRCLNTCIPRRYRKRKRQRTILYYFAIAILVLYRLHCSVTLENLSTDPFEETETVNELKRILFYNSFWNKDDYYFGFGQPPFSTCPERRCYTSNDRDQVDPASYDAVIIHGVDFILDMNTYDYIQSWRHPSQNFIFFMMESPEYTWQQYESNICNDFFNWTMTYREDSDIVRRYGWFHDQKNGGTLPDQISPDIDHFISTILPTKNASFHALATRPQSMAWMVSHCPTPSRRELFVETLQNHFNVSIFGKCGNIQCDDTNCTTYIRDNFKFYLALENAFTDDYVTEKFFSRMAELETIPIVLGQANYSHIAPPHSFINVLDYGSMEELVEFIHKVESNNSLYLSYFWWRDYYEVRTWQDDQQAFCDLCSKLWSSNTTTRTYSNFFQWWRTESHVNNVMPKMEQLVGRNVSLEPEMEPIDKFFRKVAKMRMKFRNLTWAEV